MSRSIVWNGAGLVISGVVSFLMAPLLISHLGAAFYGVWILAAALLGYSGLLDTGMRAALFRYIARYCGAGEREGLDRTLANALALTAGCAAILLGLLPPLAVWAPRFFVAAGVAREDFRLTLILVFLSLAFTFPARALGSYMNGVRRFDLFNIGVIASLLLRNGLMAGLLLAGHGIVALAAATLAAALFNLGANIVLLRRADPNVKVRWRLASWAGVRELIGYGFYAFGALCGETLRSYTDALVIARTLVVALITPFNIATKLIEYVKLLFSAAAAPLLGRMSELEGRGARSALRPVFLQATRYFTLAALFACCAFWLDGRRFIELWVGPQFDSSYRLLLILAVGYLGSLAQLPSSMLLFAVARHRFLAGLTLAEGAANLGLSIYWAHRYGLVGVALGTTLPLLVATVFVQPWYVLALIGISPARYLRRGFVRPLAAGAAFLAACSLLPLRPAGGWFGLAAAGVLQLLVFSLCTACLGLESWERRGLWELLKQRLNVRTLEAKESS